MERHRGRPGAGCSGTCGRRWRGRSDDEIARNAGVSGDTVRRYIRLTELQPELQEMVDRGKIGLTPAVELSYLKPEEQAAVIETIDSE